MSDLTDLEVEAHLRALFPAGFFDWLLAEHGDGAIGDLLWAYSTEINADGFTLVETLAREIFPNLAVEKLPDWEAAFRIAASRIALYGSDAGRQAQILARFREHGASTLANIEAALRALTGPVPGALQIIEQPRAALTDINVYQFNSQVLAGSGSVHWTWTISDNAPCSKAGCIIRIKVDGALECDTIGSATLTLSGGFTKTWTNPFGPEIGDGSFRYLYAAELADAVLDGQIATLTLNDSLGFGANVGGAVAGHPSGALIEGIGRDPSTGAEGKAANVFSFIALIDESLCTPSTYDRQLAIEVIRRWDPAHCIGSVAIKSLNGDTAGVWGDPTNSVWDNFVWE